MYEDSPSLSFAKFFYNNIVISIFGFLVVGLLPIVLMIFLSRFYRRRAKKIPSLWLFATVILSIPCSYFGDIALTYIIFFILGWGNAGDSFGGGLILGIIFFPVILLIEIISVIVIKDKGNKFFSKNNS
jgi:hypothetical protein